MGIPKEISRDAVFDTSTPRPAGGTVTLEIASNRAFTSLSYDGIHATEWLDGQNHTGSVDTLFDAAFSPEGCITDPNSVFFSSNRCIVPRIDHVATSTYPERNHGCGHRTCYLVQSWCSFFCKEIRSGFLTLLSLLRSTVESRGGNDGEPGRLHSAV